MIYRKYRIPGLPGISSTTLWLDHVHNYLYTFASWPDVIQQHVHPTVC